MARSTHALLLVAVAAAAIATSCSPAAANAGSGDCLAKVAKICQSTPYPALCTETAGFQGAHYPVVDALAVLNMQVDSFHKHTAAARARVKVVARTASLLAKTALDLCDNLYGDVEDNLGAARRAIGFKDPVTIRAMMGMAAQDMQACDEQFRKVGEKNPMDELDQSLLQISENCRALSNMI